jgi:uncharacterized membrane protein
MAMLKKWYPLLLAALAALVSAVVYPRLPDSVAIHWDLRGNPNGWMPRPIGAFALPVFILGIAWLMRLAPRVDPKGANYARFSETYELLVAAVLALVFVTHLIVLAIALGYRVPVVRIVPGMLGLLFVIIGNVMPRTRSNWAFGIRTPWTLSSERVWMRTHRLAGFTMTTAGILMLVAALFLPADLGLPIMIAAIVAAVVGPAAYSYLTWKREQQG